jgi:hypothetical protein
MANFSSKILGLAGAAILFAGMSYGQTLTYVPQTSPVQGTIIDRFEDTRALVGDLLLISGPNNVPLTNTTVTVTLNEPVTSQPGEVILNVGTNGTGTTNGTLYSGVVSGNTVTFTAVTIPANSNLVVQNVRVNASLAPSGTSGFAITESISITTGGFLNYSSIGSALTNTGAASSLTQVGIVQTGFKVPTVSGVSSYFICTGNPTAVGKTSFTITESALFAGAFKLQNNGGGQVTIAEQGSNATAAAIAVGGPLTGSATHATRFTLAFSNVPVGVTIYLPVSVNGTALLSGGTLGLAMGSQGATGKLAVVTGTGGLAAFTPSSTGTIVTWYDITTSDNITSNLTFAISGYVTAPAGFSTVPTPAITALLTPAPTTGTDVPTFAAQNYPPMSLSAFTACVTDLLFPFVTSAGFDTGVAISNTGTDPLGGAGAGTLNAPGGCTLNLYGSVTGGGTVPGPTAAPFVQGASLGVLPAPAAPQYTGTFLLSAVVPNFTGYMIAQCNFLYGHGFAYIDFMSLGSPNSTVLGYLALVLNPARGAAETATGFENLNQ